MNKSSVQRTLVNSNSSILFNNSVTHESTLINKTHIKEKPFEYPPNPTISQTNHSQLLKNSFVVQRLSQKKKHELSNLHQSIKDPNMNIFKLKEGEYDNMTYQAKSQNKQVFIPKDQIYQGRNNYKFQQSKKQYFDSIENLPRASINPFHLVPDLNPKQQDLVTQQAPIYQKLSIKNQSHILDESLMTKDFVNEGEKKSTRFSTIHVETSMTRNDLPPPSQNFTLDQSEFDLFFKQQEQQYKILMDQQQTINQYAKNHPPNFQGKSELAQLAKCMILNSQNSPSSLQLSNTVSLGKTAEDLLTISKYNDKDYYQIMRAQDKNISIPPHLKKKMTQHTQIQHGHLVFGRLAKGIIEPHNPSEKLRYSSIEEPNLRKNNYNSKNLSLKRQNLYRNLGSYNILAHSLRISNDDYLQKMEKNNENPALEMQSHRQLQQQQQFPRLFQPAFITEQQQQQQQQLPQIQNQQIFE